MIDQEIKDRYIKAGGVGCPWCETYNVRTTSKLDQQGQYIFQEVKCQDCEREWIDTYELSDINVEPLI